MLKAYVSYFISHLLNSLKDISNVNKIILFGSVARDDAKKDSDVDIFIDLKRKNKKYEKEINRSLDEFYKSREALVFKVKGIENKINLIVL